ncbi:isocitrate/isopropylmalate dehydrogenase family protein [Bordetella sp. 02P26C-1]|uniref:isocitrate/isopropylmalate dehydrogenase family protein n=1 Tax=Bordetella sp. 02P26C-1 TaxID=2683195 RepID=UPI00135460E7|nr:isocitrate/isopropylmalate family dehydrogenase [Bordetella sp. 02P26C-1]MVW79601.1 isocitrate/isopropylmalate dehydrogenase family protein [Bordetella sp. 02P26C-1]
MSKTNYKIVLLPGDGIGPEVTHAAVKVLDRASALHGIKLDYTTYRAGADYYRETGKSMDETDMAALADAHAILLGAMGLPSIRKPDGTEIAPQIDIREKYGLVASLRPCKYFPGVPSRIQADKVDMLVIRELTEGLFAGRHDPIPESNESMSDRLVITRQGCEKLFKVAFEQARFRRKTHGTPGHVTLLDKANVLRSNAFMRKVFDEVAQRYPDVQTDRIYIDAGSMMFVTQPERFDVVVTENVFGDITSEIGAGVVGGLGVAPSADVNDEMAVFQPSHGTAPDIAGKGLANPVAMILSAVMMLDWLSDKHDDVRCAQAAASLREAVAQVLKSGPKTRDIGGQASTEEVTAAIVEQLGAASNQGAQHG